MREAPYIELLNSRLVVRAKCRQINFEILTEKSLEAQAQDRKV
jgi:hypothetical protein